MDLFLAIKIFLGRTITRPEAEKRRKLDERILRTFAPFLAVGISCWDAVRTK
jgi:hypothetical protein